MIHASLTCAALALVLLTAPSPAVGNSYIETPSLAARVAAGELPPVAERLPHNPRRIDLVAMGREPGRHGGSMRMLMGDPKDIRLMVVYSYSRLVGYNDKLELVADILESYDVVEDRIFTLKLRAGHKWSDGHPLTAEDFRYYWEDVATDKKLSPTGPPMEMMVEGEIAKFEIIDPTTIRYSWSKPNPRFLPALAGGRPLFLAMPAHYMKKYHARYRKPAELEAEVKALKLQSWARLHERQSRQYRPENPDLPSLDPWVNTVPPPATRIVFKRNPYYHRVDGVGRQLPYADEVVLNIVSGQLVPAKVGSGDADLQARYIQFYNYTFLKEAEKRGQIKVMLWERGEGAKVALMPNLNASDPVWRALMRDVRVRRALSVAINRREINKAIFYGLATESANTVLPASPLYKPEYRTAWAQYDPALANRLLDAAGLDKRDSDGIRLLPDGRRAEIIVETAGESSEEADVLGLILDTWRKVGIRLFTRPTQRDLFRNRIFAGDTIMAMSSGLDNGTPTVDTLPQDFAPTSQYQLQWSKWGQHFEMLGKGGEAPDMPVAQELLELLNAWKRTGDREERRRIWHRMIEINLDQVFTIGIVNRTLQPIVVSARLRNVPDKGIFGFEPGAFFGAYLPDTFWFEAPTN